MKRCPDCGEEMFKREIVVRYAWGDGPKINVLFPGWECSYCKYQLFSPYAIRVVEGVAWQALLTGEGI